MSEYSLEKNAFSILRVSIRATREAIVEAHEERAFDGGDEIELDAARARLTIVRDRLWEELSFLADTTPARAKDILGACRTLRSASEANALSEPLENLSLINLLTDLVGRFVGDGALIRRAFGAQMAFDADKARNVIADARTVSGFGPVRDEQWHAALSKLRDAHAAVLSASLTANPAGPKQLAELMEQFLSAPLTEWARGFLDRVVSHYDRWSEPKLARIEDRLDHSISAVRAALSASEFLQEIESCIVEWDELSQPVQLRDEAHGLDEPKSKRVFQKLRDLAIWLANEQHQYRDARALSEILQRHFPELPSVLPQVQEDIATLDEMIEAARGQQIVAPLIGTIEFSKDRLPSLASDICGGHFSEGGEGLAGELFEKFEQVRRRSAELPNPDLPWYLLRSLAVDLNNDASSPAASERVLSHIVASATGDAKERIEQDLAVARTLVLSERVADCIRQGQLSQAQQLLGELSDVDPSEREKYRKLKSKIAQQQAGRTLKRVGWGGAAAFGLFMIVVNSDGTQSSTPTPVTPYLDSTDSPTNAEPMDVGGSSESVEPASADNGDEAPPPTFFYGTLSKPQLRYCVFENERLSVLEREVPPAAYSQFNARADDFNSRCNNTQFLIGDRTAIDAELALARPRLDAEARALIAQWSPSPPPLPYGDGELSATTDLPTTNDGPVVQKPNAQLDQNWLDSTLNEGSE